MARKFLTDASIERRRYWIEEIVRLSGSFGADASRVEAELNDEYAKEGEQCILDHLRLCGTIPETYGHDSSEEKLYSKYTDTVLAVAFRHMGLKTNVLNERADAADVDCVAETYSFVADAKAFRLSRTAKNQKDFKVEAMAGWKKEKPHAAVVCPIFHLPSRASQIYQQAAARNVCILTYSHLAVMVRYATSVGVEKSLSLLFEVFRTVEEMHPTKDAVAYWSAVNAAVLNASETVQELWEEERVATVESIDAARKEALALLDAEKRAIEAMSHEDAVKALLERHNIPGRESKASSIADNKLLEL